MLIPEILKSNRVAPVLRDDSFSDYLGKYFFDFPFEFSKTEFAKTNSGENENEFFVNLQVPGFSKDDLKVTVDGNQLLISADLSDEKEETKNNFYRKEFKKQSFKKMFEIPKNVSKENITSKLENGILYLTLPKEEPSKLKQNILDIKVE